MARFWSEFFYDLAGGAGHWQVRSIFEPRTWLRKHMGDASEECSTHTCGSQALAVADFPCFQHAAGKWLRSPAFARQGCGCCPRPLQRATAGWHCSPCPAKVQGKGRAAPACCAGVFGQKDSCYHPASASEAGAGPAPAEKALLPDGTYISYHAAWVSQDQGGSGGWLRGIAAHTRRHKGHWAGGDDDVLGRHLAAHIHAPRDAVLDGVGAHKPRAAGQDILHRRGEAPMRCVCAHARACASAYPAYACMQTLWTGWAHHWDQGNQGPAPAAPYAPFGGRPQHCCLLWALLKQLQPGSHLG